MSITPGPWEIRGTEGDDWHNAAYGIVAGNGDLVGFVTRRGTKEGLSNARAIAAVPEMVKLLEEAGAVAVAKRYDDLADRIAALLRRIEGEESE